MDKSVGRLRQPPAAKATGLLRVVAKPFPLLHSTNAGLGMVYSLCQTLIFARSLDRLTFSTVIAAITIGFYLLPINQAVARANFHLIRRSVVEGRGEGGNGEAAAAFYVSLFLMAAAGVVAPLLLPHADFNAYLALAAFTVSANLSNVWFFEIQTTLLAVERPISFEIANLIRRLANFAALGWLFVSHNFLMFAFVLLGQTIIAHVWVMFDVSRRSDLFAVPRTLSATKVRAHLSLLWSSLQATFAEWVSLNGPYALFTVRFGVGPALIVLDTGMKLLRIVLTVVRSLSEIALARVSRAVLNQAHVEAARLVGLVLGLSALPALAIAGLLLVREHLVWSALLGSSTIMPAGVGIPFALTLLASVGFQAGSHLVGHVGRSAEVRIFTITACFGAGAAAVYVLLARPDVLTAVWAVSAGFLVASAAGLWAIFRVLRAQRPAAA